MNPENRAKRPEDEAVPDAAERHYDCERLFDEYKALRRKTEALRMMGSDAPGGSGGPTEQDLADMGIRQEDLDRLAELRQTIDRECVMYRNMEDEMDMPEDPGWPPSKY